MVFLQNPEPSDECQRQPRLIKPLERYKSFARRVGGKFSKGKSAVGEKTVAVLLPLCVDVRWMSLGDRAQRPCLLRYQFENDAP